jgi:hypothetical protein
MNQETLTTTPSLPTHNDKTDRLFVMGIIQIILGALAGLLTLLVMVSLMSNPAVSHANAKQSIIAVLFSVLIYGGISVFFIWSGIAAIRTKRWVRPVMLSIMWPTLILGTVIFIAMVFFLPSAVAQLFANHQAGITPSASSMVTGIFLAVVLLFFVLIPGAHVAVYQNRDVYWTCQRKDPIKSWTDACPVPVLSLAIWLGVSAVFSLISLSTLVLPFFGVYITGAPAALMVLGTCLLLGFLARSIYRLKILGWWLTGAAIVLWAVSVVVTHLNRDMMEMYRLADNMEPSQLEAMTPFLISLKTPLIIGVILTALSVLIYLAAIRKHFTQSNPHETISQQFD